MNVGEYGNVFRFDAGEDISSATPTLVLEPKIGDVLTIQSSELTIPIIDVTINGKTFLGNQYVEYVIKKGDIKYAGRWRAKLFAEFSATEKLNADYVRFTVRP